MAQLVSNTVSVYPFKVENERPWYLALRRAHGRKLAGAWQVVHGHVEAGEASPQAAVRELKEETGLDPAGLWTIDHVERVYDVNRDEIRFVPCFGALVSGEPILGGEHDASRWLSAREAIGLFTFENQRRALETLDRQVGRVLAAGGEPSPFLRC